MRLPSIALALLALLAPTGPATALPEGAGGSRVEHFALELPGGPGAAGEVVGVSTLRRTGEGEDEILEWELEFPADRLVVRFVERRVGGGRRLVWRETSPGGGRTVRIEELEDGRLRRVEWGRDTGVRAEEDAADGFRFPLALLEDLRAGRGGTGPVVVPAPLAGTDERLLIVPEPRAEGRSFAWLRGDGGVHSRWDFAADGGLDGFALGAGGLEARRVPEAELGRWRRDLHPLARGDE